MCPTFLHIPETFCGIPVFGMGLALGVWLVLTGLWIVRTIRGRRWCSADTGNLVLMLVIAFVLWKVLPFISEPGKGVPIRGYGTMVLTGVCAGGWLSIVRAGKKNIPAQTLLDFLLWGLFPGILGGRLWHVVQYWPHFRKDTVHETLVSVLNVTGGGLVMYGALIGALTGWTFFAIRRKLPLLRMLDIVAPAMLLGLAFGRIGCFMFGCCFGGTCDLPWAVRFPAGAPAWNEQIANGQIPVHGITLSARDPELEQVYIDSVAPESAAESAGVRPGMRLIACDGYQGNLREMIGRLLYIPAGGEVQIVVEPDAGSDAAPESTPEFTPESVTEPTPESMTGLTPGRTTQRVTLTWKAGPIPSRSLPVHPTQLYQAIDALILCLFVLALTPLCRRDGMQLAATLTLYPISRFLLEMIRVDEKGQFGTSLSIGQWTSIVIFLAAMGLWFFIAHAGNREEKPGDTER
ncbi:MAG: prolipoprotein diacylglyceryl transferase [Planctomycetia bacterium]|nr:prolipoprotein diacylglyceryl transferase [Planctomycetia bacterium]